MSVVNCAIRMSENLAGQIQGLEQGLQAPAQMPERFLGWNVERRAIPQCLMHVLPPSWCNWMDGGEPAAESPASTSCVIQIALLAQTRLHVSFEGWWRRVRVWQRRTLAFGWWDLVHGLLKEGLTAAELVWVWTTEIIDRYAGMLKYIHIIIYIYIIWGQWGQDKTV